LGSIVAYSNGWKERFLEVSRSTIEQKGAVSKEGVVEMVRGLMQETEADYVAAVSGIAGPGGGSVEKPVGTVFIAIGKRGDRIDVGRLQGPMEREACMEFAGSMVLGALWRRVVHNAVTFS
jgi:nicotinamide-nucleotide amidase